METHTLQDIEKLVGSKDFNAELGTVVDAICKQYPVVSATEGKWAAHEAIKNMLVNRKKNNKQ